MIKVKPIIENKQFNTTNFISWLCGETKDFNKCWGKDLQPYEIKVKKFNK